MRTNATHATRATRSFGALLLSFAAACSGAAAPESTATSGEDLASKGKVASALLGINVPVDPTRSTSVPSAATLAALGATRVRLEVKVVGGAGGGAETDAALAETFRVYDPILNDYRVHGVGVLLLLDYQTLPRPKDGAPAGAWTTYERDFAARAAKIATRWDASTYEIWNEEDLCESTHYCPRVEPAEYATLLAATAKSIHDARADAVVVSGGLGSGAWEDYIGEVRVRMAGAWSQVDGVGAHPYTFWPHAKSGNRLEWQIDELARITDRPIHMTEWGGDGEEAAMIDAYFDFFRDPASASTTKKIAHAYLFGWSDAMKPGHAFGVVDANGTPKTAYARFHAGAHGT